MFDVVGDFAGARAREDDDVDKQIPSRLGALTAHRLLPPRRNEKSLFRVAGSRKFLCNLLCFLR